MRGEYDLYTSIGNAGVSTPERRLSIIGVIRTPLLFRLSQLKQVNLIYKYKVVKITRKCA